MINRVRNCFLHILYCRARAWAPSRAKPDWLRPGVRHFVIFLSCFRYKYSDKYCWTNNIWNERIYLVHTHSHKTVPLCNHNDDGHYFYECCANGFVVDLICLSHYDSNYRWTAIDENEWMCPVYTWLHLRHNAPQLQPKKARDLTNQFEHDQIDRLSISQAVS